MSTYYYLICPTHKERCHAASRTAGGYCHLVDSEATLPPFIIAHAKCPVRIVSEHDEEPYDESFTEWQAGDLGKGGINNVAGLVAKAQADARWC